MDISQIETDILIINFDVPIYARQIKQFRSAIIGHILTIKDKFKKDDVNIDYFLNRDLTDKDHPNIYRYPLIQYHISSRKASIAALNEGINALKILINNPPNQLNLENKNFSFRTESIIENKIIIQKHAETLKYRMFKWIALNEDNFKKWQKEDNLISRVNLLNNCLYGHVSNFLNAIKFHEPGAELYLRSIGMESWVKIKDSQKRAFDITFASNINLPNSICLGLHCAYGFGKVMPF